MQSGENGPVVDGGKEGEASLAILGLPLPLGMATYPFLSDATRAVAQLGRALPWGGRGRGFKSRRSDPLFSEVKSSFWPPESGLHDACMALPAKHARFALRVA